MATQTNETTTTTATEFDYETAWHQAAKPLFESLPQGVRDLFERTCEVAKDLAQDKTCDMVWPDDGGELRRAFEALDDTTLATAAQATYHYGHWSPTNTAAQTAGGTWKFANYADQVLRARLNASRYVKRGAGLTVREGMIWVDVSTSDTWVQTEVAPAIAEYAAKIRAAVQAVPGPAMTLKGEAARRAWDAYSGAIMAVAEKLRAELLPDDGSPLALCARAGEKFLVPYGEMGKRLEQRRSRATDAKRDLEKVAAAIVAIRRAEAAKCDAGAGRAFRTLDESVAHEIRLLFIGTGTSEEFNQKALARADGIEREAEALLAEVESWSGCVNDLDNACVLAGFTERLCTALRTTKSAH